VSVCVPTISRSPGIVLTELPCLFMSSLSSTMLATPRQLRPPRPPFPTRSYTTRIVFNCLQRRSSVCLLSSQLCQAPFGFGPLSNLLTPLFPVFFFGCGPTTSRSVGVSTMGPVPNWGPQEVLFPCPPPVEPPPFRARPGAGSGDLAQQ